MTKAVSDRLQGAAREMRDMTLGEAALNPDGTYNGVKALQWFHEAVSGKSISQAEIREIWAKAQEKARAKRAQEGNG